MKDPSDLPIRIIFSVEGWLILGGVLLSLAFGGMLHLLWPTSLLWMTLVAGGAIGFALILALVIIPLMLPDSDLD